MMFKKVRRMDREIEREEEVVELLISGEYGVLSTVDGEGNPYGVPLNYVYKDSSIYFHCATLGHKLENMLNNNNVSFCVVGFSQPIPEKFSTKYESAVVFGKAIEIDGDKEKYDVLLALVEKYSANFIEEGKVYIKEQQNSTKVIKIEINHLSGKRRQ